MMPAVAASFYCSQPSQEVAPQLLPSCPCCYPPPGPCLAVDSMEPWSCRGLQVEGFTCSQAYTSIQALDQLAQAGARNHSMRLVVEANTTRQRCKVAEPVSTARHQTWPCLVPSNPALTAPTFVPSSLLAIFAFSAASKQMARA
ncbi:hypothetical protein HaLaN_30611, partial [Haematococcus lacustris]